MGYQVSKRENQRFKYLDHVLPNSQILFIGDFVRIVCDLSNKIFSTPEFYILGSELAKQMLENLRKGNELKDMVQEKGLVRKIIKVLLSLQSVVTE